MLIELKHIILKKVKIYKMKKQHLPDFKRH